MLISFTLCSNNYLAQAKTLGDSFKKHHPDFEFIIGLVDDFSDQIDYTAFQDFTIIKAEDINIPDFKGFDRWLIHFKEQLGLHQCTKEIKQEVPLH